MNKLKNIGITALAGTLVSLSAAQAGGVSVSGNWELSYTNLNQEKVSGNKIGMNKNLSFGASGDISDGGAITWATTIGGSDALGLSSASMSINMGSVATLAFDSGTGGYGANAVDNVLPTAWEEIDYGLSTGITDVGRVSGAKGAINLTVRAPTVGSALSISYVGRTGGGHLADGASSGDTGGHPGVDVVVDFVNYAGPHFGFRYGIAAELELPEQTCKSIQGKDAADDPNCPTGLKDDPYAGTMYLTTKIGPLSLGTQATFKNPQETAASGILNKRTIGYGAALTFADSISVSYGEAWDRYRFNDRNRGLPVQVGSGGSSPELGGDANEYETVKFTGWSAAINMGPAALKATRNHVAGAGENASSAPRTHSEINLSIAF